MTEKPPAEHEFLLRAYRCGLQLPPLSIQFHEQRESEARDAGVDSFAEVTWRNRSYGFVVEYKSRSIPSMLRQAVLQVRDCASRVRQHPLVMVPFLDERQLRELEQEGVSGIDLCGNGVVTIPGELLVFRTGAPNRFRESAPIKNIYRGASSVVARVFLLQPHYLAVTSILEEIRSRGGNVALSTVSKVLKTLEDDLIVGRESGIIRLLQPRKLLEKLVANFRLPVLRKSVRGKVLCDQDGLMRKFREEAAAQDIPLAVTGLGSANRYSVMAREPVLSVYCTDADRLLERTTFDATSRFPNVEILETTDETAYFDQRLQNEYPWASPLQAYLELMGGDKREQESAEPIKDQLLRELNDPAPEMEYQRDGLEHSPGIPHLLPDYSEGRAA